MRLVSMEYLEDLLPIWCGEVWATFLPFGRFSPWPGLRPLPPTPLRGSGVTGVIEVLFDVTIIKMLHAAENQVGFIDVTGLLWKFFLLSEAFS